jgi:hypothetical protein
MKSFLRNNLTNYKGWKTNRKILVIESDDWGSISMPSRTVFDKLKMNGINLDNSSYCKYDNLESSVDIQAILDVLLRINDFKGNNPIITTNTVVANPDFEKIKNDNFLNYYFEPFLETYNKYGNNYNSIEIWKQAIGENLLFPQFHGREHVNVKLWLDLLRSNDSDFLLAFENKMWGLSTDVFPKMTKSIQATFDNDDFNFKKESIKSGLDIFSNIFGFKSKSFIPNNFIWDTRLNNFIFEQGVQFYQGMKFQIGLQNQSGKRNFFRHYTGDTNSLGQIYFVRNCSFEPTVNKTTIAQTLKEVRNSFFWNKPAIVSIHRVNFMGGIEENNRINNLKSFEKLLNQILLEWPEVEFLNSVQLGNLIYEDLNHDKAH